MSVLKKTKVVYAEDTGPESKEVLVDALINLEQICTILPGRKPGYLVVTMNNKMKFVLRDDIDSVLEKEQKGRGIV